MASPVVCSRLKPPPTVCCHWHCWHSLSSCVAISTSVCVSLHRSVSHCRHWGTLCLSVCLSVCLCVCLSLGGCMYRYVVHRFVSRCQRWLSYANALKSHWSISAWITNVPSTPRRTRSPVVRRIITLTVVIGCSEFAELLNIWPTWNKTKLWD